ncbi:MAG: hypothetical protein JWO38_4810 [Gemmataceae bacterium]|nr:hypothetical protein [Gemmataceae bacterium]
MSPAALRRIAGFLVLGLVLTSLPARVWLLGACPVCGQVHVPVLVAHLGASPDDPTPGSDPTDDPPPCPDDGDVFHTCCPPLPYCPTAPSALLPADRTAQGEIRPESDPRTDSTPSAALIRPPRLEG